MSKGYLELVGMQVAFENAMPRYRLINYYRRTRVVMARPTTVMRGYDLDRIETAQTIADSLRKAYAPAILSIWTMDALDVRAEYLQFEVGATPTDIDLDGEWHILP